MKENRFKSIIIYGCDSREEYDYIKSYLVTHNHKVWRNISIILCVYFICLFVSTFSIHVVQINAVLYFAFALLSGIDSLLLWTAVKPGSKASMPLIYILCALLMGFSVILGAVLAPEYLAVTTHVLLIALPLLVTEKPYRLGILELLTVISFCIVCTITKTGEVMSMDIFNAICFGLIGQFVTYFMTYTRMKQFISEKRADQASVTDRLTGLYNRMALDSDINEIEEAGKKENLIYITFDVNGLKIANDTLGHNAGDELLTAAADCIRQAFSKYGKIYRIGGDEFAAIIYTDASLLGEIFEHFDQAMSNWTGKYNDSLSICKGYAIASEASEMSMHDIIITADRNLSEDKTRYYVSKGFDRRGVNTAHKALWSLYSKILQINVTNDTYKIITISDDVSTDEYPETISQWFMDVGISDLIHPDYKAEYLAKTDINFLRNHFRSGNQSLTLYYHRKVGQTYTPVIMDIIPADNYTPEDQNLFLYVKTINI